MFVCFSFRARCKEVSEREEEARNKLTVLQNARIAAEQEVLSLFSQCRRSSLVGRIKSNEGPQLEK